MARPALTISDYKKLAEEKSLIFLESEAPGSVRTSVRWQCKLTGVVSSKSYQAVKNGKNGSRYTDSFMESYQAYTDLANRLGIAFVYDPVTDYFPANTKTPCYWQGPSGKLVSASYTQLAYTPRKFLLDELGVTGNVY